MKPGHDDLDELVDAAREFGPSSKELADLVSRSGSRIEPSDSAPSTPEVTPVEMIAGVSRAKLAIGLGVVGAILAGWGWMERARHPNAETSVNASSSALVKESPIPTSSEPRPLISTEPIVSAVPSTMAVPVKSNVVRMPEPMNSGEADLLDAARAALRQDPARALRLTDEHRRRFPNGALTQEREAIRLVALRRLGKTDEAQRDAERFRQEHPDSVHRERVDGMRLDAGVGKTK